MYAVDPDERRQSLSTTLHHYGQSLREAQRFHEACDAGAEDVTLMRQLYVKDADSYRARLSISLRYYAISLRAAKRYPEASDCHVGAEQVLLDRQLHASDAERNCSPLSISLCYYGVPLRGAGQFELAGSIGTESVEFSDQLYDTDPGKCKDRWPKTLKECCISMRRAGVTICGTEQGF